MELEVTILAERLNRCPSIRLFVPSKSGNLKTQDNTIWRQSCSEDCDIRTFGNSNLQNKYLTCITPKYNNSQRYQRLKTLCFVVGVESKLFVTLELSLRQSEGCRGGRALSANGRKRYRIVSPQSISCRRLFSI